MWCPCVRHWFTFHISYECTDHLNVQYTTFTWSKYGLSKTHIYILHVNASVFLLLTQATSHHNYGNYLGTASRPLESKHSAASHAWQAWVYVQPTLSCEEERCRFSFQISRSISVLLCNLNSLTGWSPLENGSTSCFGKMESGALSGNRCILQHDNRVWISEATGLESLASLC